MILLKILIGLFLLLPLSIVAGIFVYGFFHEGVTGNKAWIRKEGDKTIIDFRVLVVSFSFLVVGCGLLFLLLLGWYKFITY